MVAVDPLRNLLLAALPADEIAYLNGAVDPVAYTQNEPLYQANQPLC
jgi:hypothetical protein